MSREPERTRLRGREGQDKAHVTHACPVSHSAPTLSSTRRALLLWWLCVVLLKSHTIIITGLGPPLPRSSHSLPSA